jgi:hypothetical protein
MVGWLLGAVEDADGPRGMEVVAPADGLTMAVVAGELGLAWIGAN